jgi:hypothetical protein
MGIPLYLAFTLTDSRKILNRTQCVRIKNINIPKGIWRKKVQANTTCRLQY